MAPPHIVKSYDNELNILRETIAEMGQTAYEQLEKSTEALLRGDRDLAEGIVERDSAVDDLEVKVDRLSIDILAKRQPFAGDLRVVICSQKIAADFERIADYASNLAKNVVKLDFSGFEEPVNMVVEMAMIARRMLKEIVRAYLEVDLQAAADVYSTDQEINHLFDEFINVLNKTVHDIPRSRFRTGMALILMGRSVERIGDHIKGVAENLHYMMTGEDPDFC